MGQDEIFELTQREDIPGVERRGSVNLYIVHREACSPNAQLEAAALHEHLRSAGQSRRSGLQP
jgi:hypothetical protein